MGVDAATLSRFMAGGSGLSETNLDKLMAWLEGR